MSRVSHLFLAPQGPAAIEPSPGRGWVHQFIEDAGFAGTLDARQILSQHPSLRRSKSAVLDLAYEEYCRRVEAGEELNAEQFAQAFPGYQTSLIRQIEAHHDLADELPELLAGSTVWPSPAEEFLGFRLREELGRGAFSRVFLAEELALGDRLVVAKVSRFSGLEPHALGRLRHPHIVPVHSVQVDDGRGLSLICMPFFGRATLCDLLDVAFHDGEPPGHGSVLREAMHRADPAGSELEEAPRRSGRVWWQTSYTNAILNLAVQIADALQFAHAKGIYHCDIKPSNVLLCPSGAKLFDFNLALDGEALGSKGGTLPYMAPEQLRVVTGEDRAARIDPRTDLFSLGVVLYELFCGKLPWARMSRALPPEELAAELLASHRQGAPPIEDAAQVNASLSRLIQSCLAFDPGGRPRSADELVRALRAELGVSARGARLAREHRRAALATLGAVVLGAIGLGYAWQTAEPYLECQERLGRAALEDQQYERALSCFEPVLNAAPDNLTIRFLHGRSLMLLGRHDEGREDFDALQKVAPEDAYVLASLGTCLAGKRSPGADDYERASVCLRKALQSLPNDAALLSNMAYCDQHAGRLGLAEARFKEAVVLAETEPIVHFHLAAVAFMRWLETPRRHPELSLAQQHIERAIQLSPGFAGFHLLTIEILCRQLESQPGSATTRNAKIEAALKHCEAAWDFGCYAEQLKLATSSYEPLCATKRYQDVPKRQRVMKSPAQVAPLLDPLAAIDITSFRLPR